MTREDIIKLAREAGLAYGSDANPLNSVTRFASLVAAAEREECAKACEQIANELSNWPAAYDVVTAETKFVREIGETIGKPFIEAIRARSNK